MSQRIWINSQPSPFFLPATMLRHAPCRWRRASSVYRSRRARLGHPPLRAELREARGVGRAEPGVVGFVEGEEVAAGFPGAGQGEACRKQVLVEEMQAVVSLTVFSGSWWSWSRTLKSRCSRCNRPLWGAERITRIESDRVAMDIPCELLWTLKLQEGLFVGGCEGGPHASRPAIFATNPLATRGSLQYIFFSNVRQLHFTTVLEFSVH